MTFETIWTLANIKAGFDKFILEEGRLPTAHEIDNTNFLPSSRQIQRGFGGLKRLRQDLGYEDIDFGSGENRSASATKSSIRGLKSEQELEIELIHQFGELYVHTEKRYGRQGSRLDFMVFTPEGNIGIDIFYPNTIRTLQSNVNIKIPKYLDFPKSVPLYFVCANLELSEDDIEYAAMHMGKMRLIPRLRVTGLVEFRNILAHYSRYPDPANYQSLILDDNSAA